MLLVDDTIVLWCGREDLNLHGIAPTATSRLRVYQFRHVRVRAECTKGLYPCRYCNKKRADRSTLCGSTGHSDLAHRNGYGDWVVVRKRCRGLCAQHGRFRDPMREIL